MLEAGVIMQGEAQGESRFTVSAQDPPASLKEGGNAAPSVVYLKLPPPSSFLAELTLAVEAETQDTWFPSFLCSKTQI